MVNKYNVTLLQMYVYFSKEKETIATKANILKKITKNSTQNTCIWQKSCIFAAEFYQHNV